ncbi:MAG: lamin tail domain-containing protein [Phycisphaerae bacterium]|nr:lamin tail domain-containing protein [Phycisphaerae bacterium]
MKRLSILLGILLPLVWGMGPGAVGAAAGDLATPVISEFMAGNGSQKPLGEGDLLDANGDSSDWIELYNPTAGTFDLGGWYLTDDPNKLAKWRFPSPTILAPDGYLLVFASGKDRTTGELHTNFKLAADGGYLALVLSDDRTVAYDFGPSYPPQLTDVSYGLTQSRVQFVTSQSTASYRVPSIEDEGLDWTVAAFDDGSWRTAPASLSLSSVGADPTVRTKGNLRDQMLGKNTSVWIRIGFEASQIESFDSLLLSMQYEDGFVAYLNGVEVARDNFPGTPRWDSAAGSDRPDGRMSQPVAFDISAHKGLLRPGHNVLAIQGLNDNRANSVFLIASALVASGAAQVPQYLAMPTPGRPNTSGPLEVVAGPRFSHEHGFYDTPFTLTLSCDTPGALIRYTTDGKPPSETNGLVYGGSLTIRTTTCVRAMAFKPGARSRKVDTRTFIFAGYIQQQPSSPPGFPATWGSTPADYEMDPEIVNGGARVQMTQVLKSLPTMSIVMNVDDLFGAQGIYPNPWGQGVQWERPASVEWIDPNRTQGFHVDAGLRVYGGAFRGFNLSRKKSFRLLFKSDYGPTELKFPLFEEEDAATSFDQIILRAGANDAWNDWGRASTQYIVDEFLRRTQLALGQPAVHGTFVHLYLNGLYWGLYNLTERPVESFCATYFGGEETEWDAVNRGEARGDSNLTTWNAMLNLARQGMETNANYQRLQGNNPDGTPNPAYNDLLDVDNYIDYMFSNFWGGTGDWPGHNYYAACRRPPNATGFKFFNWDSEGALVIWSSLNANVTNVGEGAAQPYAALRQNPDFCLLFADHVQKHLFHEGPATPGPSYDRYKKLADQVELAIIAESARWGDQSSATPYTVTDWRKERDYILNTYMPQRSAIVLSQLKNAGLYPAVDAPVFVVNGLAQQGGAVPSNSPLTLMAPPGAAVYYTTDGSDPRQPGYLAADNKIITLVPENAPKRVLVPSVANGGDRLANLSPGFAVTFYKAKGTVSSLTLAEAVIADGSQQAGTAQEQARVINYFNTGSPGNFDSDRPFPGTTTNADVENYVVLVTGKVMIPQAGNWTFGVSSDDGFGMTLSKGAKTYAMSYPDPRSPGDTLTVFNIAEPGVHDLRLVFYEQGGGSELELFAARGSFTTFSAASFRLVGDVARGGLQVGEDNIWFTNSFNDSSWRLGTGGVGYERSSGYEALLKIDVGAEMYQINGSCYLRIPFTLANASFSNLLLKVRYDDGFIAYLNGAEVARRNFTGNPQWNSVGSADNPDTMAVTPTIIDISDYAGLLGPGANLLAIHGLNGTIDSSDFLISVELAGGELSQGTVAPAAIPYTGPLSLKQSKQIRARAFNGKWSALNEAVFAVGPVAQSLRVSELMYHPLDTGNPNDPNTEFIELTNTASQSINLNLVRFTDGIDYACPSFDLPAGGYCLVVKDLAAFQAKYGSKLPVVGQYVGSLDNGGERLELVDAVGQVIQSFTYEDNWFKTTDGQGFSLTVKDPKTSDASSLSDKNTWCPSSSIGGSPGRGD